MNPLSRFRAAMNMKLFNDATRETTLAGIQKVAPQGALFQNPSVAAAYAALATSGATFTTNVATAAASEKVYHVSISARDLSRLGFDLALDTYKTAVENNATSAQDITGMGLSLLTVAPSSKTAPPQPGPVLAYPGKVHGTARVVIDGKGYLGHFVAQVSPDPVGTGTWGPLPGVGKERKLSGYPSGTKLWVQFAQIRWGLQGPWSVPVCVTIP